MHLRKLGNSDLTVSAIGLGCMSMSGTYGKSDDEQSIAVVHRAIDLGVTFIDSSDMYGWGHNEELLGRALKGRRGRVVLATKFGQVQSPDGKGNLVDGSPAYVARACDASLKRLGVDVIDVYFQHRVDPKVPIEDTVGAMKRLIEQGKVRALGLSEAAPTTIRRAQAVHPISAVQSEYSLLYRNPAEETLPTCRERGISYIAYSPLGRGFLTGSIRTDADLPVRRPPAAASALPDPELRPQPQARAPHRGDGEREGLHHVPVRPRLAPRAGRGYPADPRHEAHRLPRGEPRRPERPALGQ